MQNQPVKSAVLHASIEFPGLEASVSINASKYPGLELAIVEQFLKLDYKGRSGLVPLTNVKFIILG